MSENQHSEQKQQETVNKIDITQWLDRFFHSFKRFWWLAVLLMAAFAGYNYFHVTTNYIPTYTAEATLTISATSEGQQLGSDSYSNITTTEQLAKVFSSIVSSGTLNTMIAEDLGTDSTYFDYNVTAVSGTNMLTVTATSHNSGQEAYDILQAVIKDYPEVAQFVVGQTTAVKLDDSGVPEDTGKAYQTRGSIKKGACIGLLLAILVMLFDMVLQRTIRYESDFTSLLHVQCLGALPEIKAKKRKKGKAKEISILNSNIQDGYLEAIRSLRSRIERRMEKENEKTILVTSSVPAEGKSTVAANLAAAFGRKGKKVVLVDCDLRHPSLKEKLDIEGSFPGLEAVLEGKADFSKAMYKIPGMEVYVLCGADESSENIEILGSMEMQKLIHQMEMFADVVILDTSPSAMLADAITLAKHVPLALYVVRCNYARVRNILDGIEELSDTGIKVIGCTMNYSRGRSGRKSGYGYGYGYGYGSSYGYGRGSYGKYGYGSKRRFGRKEEEEETESPDLAPIPASLSAIGKSHNEIEFPQLKTKPDVEIPMIGNDTVQKAAEEATAQTQTILYGQEESPDENPQIAGFNVELPEEPIAEAPVMETPIMEAPVLQAPVSAAPTFEMPDAEISLPESSLPESSLPESAISEVESLSQEKQQQLQQLTEQAAQLDNEIADLDLKISLVAKCQQLRSVVRTYKSLTGPEKRSYYQDHVDDIQDYNETVIRLKEMFGVQKTPSLKTMKAEKNRMLGDKIFIESQLKELSKQ